MATIVTSAGRVYSIDATGLTTETDDEEETRPALTLPAVKGLSQELASTMEQWFKSGREKRLGLLGDHVELAIRISGQPAIETVSESPAFMEWAEGASTIDLKDKELADVWQAALLAMQKGGPERLRLLAIAKAMQPDEAQAFVALARDKKQISAVGINRLKALGLIKTITFRLFNRVSLFAYMLVFSFVSLLVTFVLASPVTFPALADVLIRARTVLGGGGDHLPTTVLVLSIGSLATSVPMILHIILDATPLTDEGKSLLRLLEKVTAARKKAT